MRGELWRAKWRFDGIRAKSKEQSGEGTLTAARRGPRVRASRHVLGQRRSWNAGGSEVFGRVVRRGLCMRGPRCEPSRVSGSC